MRNYKVKKDFDSIEKIEFRQKAFNEVKDYLKRFTDEIEGIDNIKTRVIKDNSQDFECLLVNRNKIATESALQLSIAAETSSISWGRSNEKNIQYSITGASGQASGTFHLASDDYHLYWSDNSFYPSSHNNKDLGSKEIAEKIWNSWLESVGID